MNLNWVKWSKFIIRQTSKVLKEKRLQFLSTNLPLCFWHHQLKNLTLSASTWCHVLSCSAPCSDLLTTNMDPYHRLFKHSHISHIHMLHLEKKWEPKSGCANLGNLGNTKQNDFFLSEASKTLPGVWRSNSKVCLFCWKQVECCQTRALPRDTWRSLYMLPTLGRQQMKYYLCIRNQKL